MKIKTDKTQYQSYLNDAANIKGNCERVYLPEDISEIIEILKEANQKQINVTVRGGGTGLTGGSVPEDGILISMEMFNSILEINSNEMFIRTQPGVTLQEIQNRVEEENLFYPPDPTERNCFIGGTISTNASGARSFKYGATRSFIEELKIILPTGKLINIKRNQVYASESLLKLTTSDHETIELDIKELKMPETKNATGYFCKKNMDAIDLFIGAEGTLGIIVEAKLRLIELPKEILSCVVFFDDYQDALTFIEEAREKSYSKNSILDARALEYLDKHALEFIKKNFPSIPNLVEAAVWFEQEINGSEETLLNKWFELVIEHKGRENSIWYASDKLEIEKIKSFRHSVSKNVNEFITQNNLVKVGTDTAVPHQVFSKYYEYCIKKVEEEKLKYIVYGHFGNSHIHLNMLPQNKEELKVARTIYKTLCEKAVQLNGTVSAEHGIGKLKKEYFKNMVGLTNIETLKFIKNKIDTNNILNIGNIFD